MPGLKRLGFLFIILIGLIWLAGCGGGSNKSLVRLDFKNLGQLTPSFTYAAWVQQNGKVALIETFNTNADGTASISGFSILGTLTTGDRIFVTIESASTINPSTPSIRRVLDGTIAGNTAVLTFPRMQDFANAQAFITVGLGNIQILAEFTNLPDVSDLGFIYQGFLIRNGTPIPLKQFNFNSVPVSDTVGFDVTTASYLLSIEPVPDFDPSSPYTIRPFSTNGNLLPLIRQQLVKSSLTPGNPNFNFPSGTASLR